ncbi:Cytochrome c heme lyase subunit CcmF [Salmonella enterica subsp. arizonae]|uniref:Cytochrome c heme lyase subunit CcmF n=1 Tax=Salmonella enterica subsp. arizonae TaxID=59203 RepID=A0A379T2W2_SALER|nr:Cytochrome c heme lyase subunit CcmF [Salmonella enterica subsp. arizonae]
MMPEIGNALLCLALGVALLLSVYPLWGAARGDARMMASSGVFAWLLFLCVAARFLCWRTPLVVNDFTVAYVAGNSNTQLPIWYRVAATWGAHEGSLLLWVLLMSGLDPGGGGVQQAGAGGYCGPGAGGDGDGQRRFPGVYPVHLQPVRPHAAGLPGGGARPESIVAGSGADFPSAAAVHGLCRFLGGLRLCHRRAAVRASGQRVCPFFPVRGRWRRGCS